ncbi:MAG: hypothetical protein WCT41_00570 [Candidatus Paceibacterota bacterium]
MEGYKLQSREEKIAELESIIAEEKRLIEALQESDSLKPEWKEKQIGREQEKKQEAEEALAKLQQKGANDDEMLEAAESSR